MVVIPVPKVTLLLPNNGLPPSVKDPEVSMVILSRRVKVLEDIAPV